MKRKLLFYKSTDALTNNLIELKSKFATKKKVLRNLEKKIDLLEYELNHPCIRFLKDRLNDDVSDLIISYLPPFCFNCNYFFYQHPYICCCPNENKYKTVGLVRVWFDDLSVYLEMLDIYDQQIIKSWCYGDRTSVHIGGKYDENWRNFIDTNKTFLIKDVHLKNKYYPDDKNWAIDILKYTKVTN